MNKRVKTYKSEVSEVSTSKREIVAIISTDSVDSDDEVLLPSGLIKKQFAGMPILWAHQHEEPAIGVVRWVKPEERRIIAKYYVHCKTQTSREVWELLSNNPPLLNSHSVGCTYLETTYPTAEQIKSRPDWEHARLLVTKWDMHEFSVCNVPANEDCVLLAVEKGIKLLGEPKPDCWKWEQHEPKKIVIPKAKYCKSWKSIEAEMCDVDRLTAEIIARLKGKA